MKLLTKFRPGERVYKIDYRIKEALTECPECEGARWVMLKTKEYPCPACHGTGKLVLTKHYRWEVNPKSHKIIGISARVAIDDPEELVTRLKNVITAVSYTLSFDPDKEWSEHSLFLRMDSATLECERLNNELDRQEAQREKYEKQEARAA